MNVVVLSGNLGDDPTSKYTTEGMHIESFSMAFTSTKNKTGWIRVTCFDKIADIAEKYLHKGAKVAITGQIEYEKWTNDNNEVRTSIKIIARGIDFIKIDGKVSDNTKENGYTDEIPF